MTTPESIKAFAVEPKAEAPTIYVRTGDNKVFA
jgi:hypothetical protein